VDYHYALQLRAMHAVVHPDGEAFMRRVKRFYSKTFNVPLPDVDDVPEEDVLTAFYEETFSSMMEDDREELLQELLMSPEERLELAAAHEKADERDEEFMKKLNEDVKTGKRRGPPPERPKLKVTPGSDDPREQARLIKERISKGIMTPDEPASTDGPLTLPSPPDIHMRFEEGDGNLPGIPAEWLDMDPSGAPSPKK
jgi:hypothetical protein